MSSNGGGRDTNQHQVRGAGKGRQQGPDALGELAEPDARDPLSCGIGGTDRDLAATFGPSWQRVAAVVHQARQMTESGPYTVAMRDRLFAPWAAAFGED